MCSTPPSTGASPPRRWRSRIFPRGSLLSATRISNFEGFLDAARVFAGEENFLIGLRLFAGSIEPDQAARGFSALAEAIVRACFARVEKHFAAEHGVIVNGRCVVLGLGKLGSREMTATSDLDLVLLYDFDSARPEIRWRQAAARHDLLHPAHPAPDRGPDGADAARQAV